MILWHRIDFAVPERRKLQNRRIDTMARVMTKTLLVIAALGSGLVVMEACSAQGSPNNKPFESTYRRPNVSPYLQIQQQGLNPLQNQNIFQTMVQPQLQQQHQQIEQLQQRRQLQQVQSQVANMNSPRSRQVDESIRPTGHASTYMNYSHYYPMRR